MKQHAHPNLRFVQQEKENTRNIVTSPASSIPQAKPKQGKLALQPCCTVHAAYRAELTLRASSHSHMAFARLRADQRRAASKAIFFAVNKEKSNWQEQLLDAPEIGSGKLWVRDCARSVPKFHSGHL